MDRPRPLPRWRKRRMQRSDERQQQLQKRSAVAKQLLRRPAHRVSFGTSAGAPLWLALRRTEQRRHSERSLAKKPSAKRKSG